MSTRSRRRRTYHRRSPADGTCGQRSVLALQRGRRPVLQLGEASAPGSTGSVAQWGPGPEEERPDGPAASRDRAASGGYCRTQRREPGAKKGALAIGPSRRYSATEKALILETVQRAQERTGESVAEILAQLGLPEATYYRWQAREQAGCLTDQVVVPGRRVVSPTPAEILAARDFLGSSADGLQASGLADGRSGCGLLAAVPGVRAFAQGRSALPPSRATSGAVEAAGAARPRRRGVAHRPHVPYIVPRRYYLVDIVDGYSRFLVHWSLNLTMLADTVTLAVQEAPDGLPQRCAGEPKLIHDRGGQFLSKEWREFVKSFYNLCRL